MPCSTASAECMSVCLCWMLMWGRCECAWIVLLPKTSAHFLLVSAVSGVFFFLFFFYYFPVHKLVKSLKPVTTSSDVRLLWFMCRSTKSISSHLCFIPFTALQHATARTDLLIIKYMTWEFFAEVCSNHFDFDDFLNTWWSLLTPLEKCAHY